MTTKNLSKISRECVQEVVKANKKYGSGFNSLHEAHSVLREEFEELWDEIKKKNPDLNLVRAEAVQVAAMAIKLIDHVDEVCR